MDNVRLRRTILPPCRDQRPRRRVTTGIAGAWWVAVAVSILVHLLFGTTLAIWAHAPAMKPDLDTTGAVELLMVEKQGSTDAGVPAPAQPSHPASPGQTTTRDTAAEPVPAGLPAPPDASEPASVPGPAPERTASIKPAPPTPAAKPDQPAPDQPPEPRQQETLKLDLEGTDSESNAIVIGGRVIPASPDDRFRNRPPVYPYEAAVRGEHGAVLLVIHVSDTGLPTGADIRGTSGYASLDRAALDAVRKWHFRPALKDGKAVPFDMAMRFIFDSE